MRNVALAVAAVCALCLLYGDDRQFFQPAAPQFRGYTATAPVNIPVYRTAQGYYTAVEPYAAEPYVVAPGYPATPLASLPIGPQDRAESVQADGAGWLLAGLAALGAVSALGSRVASLAVTETKGVTETKRFAGPALSGQATAVGPDGKVYSFGGRPADQSEAQVCDDLWCFDPALGSWEQLAVAGGPTRRMYAAAAVLGDEMLVTGGWDPAEKGSGGVFFDEVWLLNLNSMSWRQLDPLPQGEVSRHVAATCGGKILIHTFRADKAIMVYDPVEGAVREQPTTGFAPQRLGMHIGVGLRNNFVVFGGNSNTAGFNKHAFALNTLTWEWTRLNVGEESPNPIGSMCATTVGEKMIAFGGAEMGSEYNGGKGLVARGEVWEFRMLWGGMASWTRLQADHISGSDSAQTPRVAASLNVLPDGQLLLNGGWCPSDGSTIAESTLLRLD